MPFTKEDLRAAQREFILSQADMIDNTPLSAMPEKGEWIYIDHPFKDSGFAQIGMLTMDRETLALAKQSLAVYRAEDAMRAKENRDP